MHPLISARELRGLAAPFVLLDARSAEAYRLGHLQGAQHADLDRQLSTAGSPGHDPARGGRHPLPAPADWAAQLGAWGVAPGVPVVVYDDTGGGNAGARAWWMLRAAGHTDSAVLDGGLQAARADGFALSQEPAAAAAQPPYPFTAWGLPTVTIGAVEDRLRDPGWKLLDVRSAPRWRGDEEPLDPVPGRIPGALNAFWQENLEADGRFKPAAELRAMFEQVLDGTPPERLMVHCGSGVTACQTLLALEAAGLRGAILYVGSWSEWCRSGRPIGRGPA